MLGFGLLTCKLPATEGTGIKPVCPSKYEGEERWNQEQKADLQRQRDAKVFLVLAVSMHGHNLLRIGVMFVCTEGA